MKCMQLMVEARILTDNQNGSSLKNILKYTVHKVINAPYIFSVFMVIPLLPATHVFQL